MVSSTPFLDKLETASDKKDCGLYLFEQYLTSDNASAAYEILNSDESFPWDLHPKLYGEKLTQHAYEYERYTNETKASKAREEFAGVAYLERLCQEIEQDFDGEIEDVFCNRFQDPEHSIPWHKDAYGRHIFVLCLGSSRKVQFRHNKSKEIETLEPGSGVLYFFPLGINDTHQHRVCAAENGHGGTGTRLSLVFFFKPPEYAKEFKITRMQKLKGLLTSVTGIGA